MQICRGSIELEENEFFKKGKTHRDECNKQATPTWIQSTCKDLKNISNKKM